MDNYILVDESDIPDRFDQCGDFITACSNGFIGDLSLSSAFLHGPSSWPQCFQNGQDSDCTIVCLKLLSTTSGEDET